jgi:transcription initiation factor IIE alpha subunit
MVEQSQTEILVCPNHGPMSNRDATHYQDRIGVVISCCPVCGRVLEFVEMGEVERRKDANHHIR